MEKQPKIENKKVKKNASKVLLTVALSAGLMAPQDAGTFKTAKAENTPVKNNKKIEASAPATKDKRSKKDISFEEAKLLPQASQAPKEDQTLSEEAQPENQIVGESKAEVKKEIIVP